ncbi:MAG: sugar ABC transporter substrate-binding protein [Nocardioidaceae bacterium]
MDDHKAESGTASRRSLLAGGLAGLGLFAASCQRQAEDSSSGGNGVGNFPNTPEYNFVFINHVTTNPFFTATQYGIKDAGAVFGTKYQWTGSENSIVSEMVNAFNTAISQNADGIAVAIVDPKAFNEPINRALAKGIPVVAYNANGAPGKPNPALAYIGQDLYESGRQMGQQVVDQVGSGPVALFIATPGQLNIQPRIDGAKDAIQQSGADIQASEVTTGAKVNDELNRIDAYYQGHKDVKGMFAVDAGSTQGVGQVMKKYSLHDKGIKGGGYDLLPKTLQNIKQGHLDFTIDQQAYLQGFQPVVQLYLYNISGGLLAPTDTNTSLKFITRENADPYLQSDTRYEGSAKKQKALKRPSKIQPPA